MTNNQITYTDKVNLNNDTSIPDINKVNDTDMNMIKQVVNAGVVIENGINQYGSYTKFASGLAICWLYTENITTNPHEGVDRIYTLPCEMKDMYYYSAVHFLGGGSYWADVNVFSNPYSTSQVVIHTYNTSGGAHTSTYQILVIGWWK